MRKVILQRLFDLLYTKFAWAYDLVAWIVSFGHWNRWTEMVLPHILGDRVLELGHGPGHLLGRLLAVYPRSLGIDASPGMSRLARRNLAKENREINLIYGYAQFIPLASNSMDTIISTFPSDYIFSSQVHQEVVRVLHSSGVWLIVIGVRITGSAIHYRLLDLLYRTVYPNNDRIADTDNPAPAKRSSPNFSVIRVEIPGPFWKVQLLKLYPKKV